jgi:hypothetical protein
MADEPKREPFQFGLKAIFGLTTAVSLSLVAIPAVTQETLWLPVGFYAMVAVAAIIRGTVRRIIGTAEEEEVQDTGT